MALSIHKLQQKKIDLENQIWEIDKQIDKIKTDMNRCKTAGCHRQIWIGNFCEKHSL